MAQHIVLMNLLAPLLALALLARFRRPRLPSWPSLSLPAVAEGRPPRSMPLGGLALAATAQLALLWAWHIPSVLEVALASGPLHGLMQASLFLSALWFWTAVLARAGSARWRALLALLATSKLFCLLGVLLVFAPRALYGGGPPGVTWCAAAPLNLMADQQMAGLMMLVACPVSYLLAGVMIAARWLSDLDGAPPAAARAVADA
jgi:putative membrane protein